MRAIFQALASLAAELGARSVSLVSSSHRAVQTFLAEATAAGISVPRILELSNHRRDLHRQPHQVEAFLKHSRENRGDDGDFVVLIVGPREIVALADHLRGVGGRRRHSTWLIGSLGLDVRRLSSWSSAFHGRALFVEPRTPELKAFKEFFVKSLARPDPTLSNMVGEYKKEMFGCTNSRRAAASSFLAHCDEIPAEEIDLRFQQDPHVSFVVKAVSALTAAFRLVQLDHCANSVEAACLRKVRGGALHEDILGNLRKLSFSASMPHGGGGNGEVEGTQHHFTRSGHLVADKQEVYVIDRTTGMELIGFYSEDKGLNLGVTLADRLPTTEEPVSSPLVTKDVYAERSRGGFARSIAADNRDADSDDDTVKMHSPAELETLPIFSYESFISRTWALIVVTAAAFGFLVSLWMLLYVFQKICDGTLSGNQSMGVILLAGVMLLFASVVPWLLPPNETVCVLRHVAHPLLLVLCFSVLLVKSMQLRSLVSIGLGGTIPHVNQLVSLFFMVIVQVVIAAEWYMATQPIGVRISSGYPECGVQPSRFLLLHLYPTSLLLFTFFYGVSVLKVKRNFNEGRWITCATVFIIPIFVAWPAVYYFAPVPFHDPSVAVSVLAVAGILLATIFLPKMHTIALAILPG